MVYDDGLNDDDDERWSDGLRWVNEVGDRFALMGCEWTDPKIMRSVGQNECGVRRSVLFTQSNRLAVCGTKSLPAHLGKDLQR